MTQFQVLPQNAEFSTFLDPNYDASLLYGQIEPFLLLYDRVFLYAPRAYGANQSSLGKNRLLDLIKTEFVVPVGRRANFDRVARDKSYAWFKTRDPDRAKVYKWVNGFDDELQQCQHKRIVRFASDDREPGEMENTWATQLKCTESFRWLQERVIKLRAKGNLRLPEQMITAEEYKTLTNDQLTQKLLYHLGADVEVLEKLDDPTCIITSDNLKVVARLYSQLSQKVFTELTDQEKRECGELSPVYQPPYPAQVPLYKDDLKIAKEFARRVSNKYNLAGILKEYKQSNYSKQFRVFVRQVHQEIIHGTSIRIKQTDIVDALLKRLDSKVARLRDSSATVGTSISTGLISAAAVAAGTLSLDPDILKSFVETLRLTSTLKIIGTIGATAIGSGVTAHAKKPFAEALVKTKAGIINPQEKWISLIAFKAKT